MIVDPEHNYMAEYIIIEYGGEFFIRIMLDREYYGDFGPFSSYSECESALADLTQMMREGGAVDITGMQ